jgi:HSP20 family molecular chaperone IbpA
MSLLYNIHRYFGFIRNFKPMKDCNYLYVRPIPGHNKNTVKISYPSNGLICIEGYILQKDTDTQEIIYQNRFHELINIPSKVNINTLNIDIKDGVLYIQAHSTSMQGL